MYTALMVLLAGVLGVALPSFAQAQSSRLVIAYRAALEHDATYRAARDEARAALEQLEVTRSAWRPEVALSASALGNRLEQSVGQADRSAQYGSSSLSLQWRKALLNRELESRESLAGLRAQQAEALLALRHTELTRRLVDAYLDLARAKRVISSVSKDLARQVELLEVAHRGLASGEGTVTDVLETSSRIELLQAQRAAAEAGRDDALDNLAVISGRAEVWESWENRESERAVLAKLQAPQVETVVAALSESPERRIRILALQMAQEEVRLASAAAAPRLELIASASRGDSDAVNSFNQVNNLWSAGVQFTMPLLDGGRSDGNVRVALALVDKAHAELDNTERRLNVEARQSLRALNTAEQRVSALRFALEASEQLVSATQRSLVAGLRSRVDLLVAERQLSQVQRELDQAAMDKLRSWWQVRTLQRQILESDLLELEQAVE